MNITDYPPDINQLPEEPIRILCHQPIRRLPKALLIGGLLSVGIYSLCVGLLPGVSVDPRLVLEVSGCAFLYFGLMVMLFRMVIQHVEVSREGVQSLGRFRKSGLFRWSDFREQRVAEGPSPTAWQLVDSNGLVTGSLLCHDAAPEEEQWLLQLIHSVWVRPPADSAPTVLFIRSRSRGMAAADAEGLLLCDAGLVEHNQLEAKLTAAREQFELGHTSEWSQLVGTLSGTRVNWQNVTDIEVWQLEHGRHDFERLTLSWLDPAASDGTASHTWHFRYNTEHPLIRGTTPQAILALVLQHCHHAQVRYLSHTGPPRNLDEWKQRYDRFVVGARKQLRWFPRTICGVLIAVAATAVISRGALAAATALALMAIPVLLAGWWIRNRDLRQLEARYAEWKTRFDTNVSAQQ